MKNFLSYDEFINEDKNAVDTNHIEYSTFKTINEDPRRKDGKTFAKDAVSDKNSKYRDIVAKAYDNDYTVGVVIDEPFSTVWIKDENLVIVSNNKAREDFVYKNIKSEKDFIKTINKHDFVYMTEFLSFKEFVNEDKVNIEAIEDKNGDILFGSNGELIAKLNFDVYYKDKDKKRDAEIAKIFTKKFPPSKEWKFEVKNIKGVKYDGLPFKEELKLHLAKERNFGKEIGQIQIWDNSKMETSITLSGPFQDVTKQTSGKYVGGIFFKEGTDKKTALNFWKEIQKYFKDSPKPTKNIIPN